MTFQKTTVALALLLAISSRTSDAGSASVPTGANPPSRASSITEECDFTFKPDCDDGDMCTIDLATCNGLSSHDWACSHHQVSCSPGLSCDPMDGLCKSDDQLIPCVAVIDEDDNFYGRQTAKWNEFRTLYPNRPFCLLVPNPEGDIGVPAEFLSDPNTMVQYDIVRDFGDVSQVEDWVRLCGLDKYAGTNNKVGWVGLFIDDSGSMWEYEVAASRDLFYESLASAGIQVKKVVNGDENWIEPFLTTLVPEAVQPSEPPRRPSTRRYFRGPFE